MAERQALNDLLAAINSNRDNEQSPTFPPVSPMPGGQMPQFQGQVTGPAAANPMMPGARQPVSRQLPNANHPRTAQQVPGVHPARAALASTTSKDTNLLELQNLLGRSSAAAAARQTNAATQQMFAQQSGPGSAPLRQQAQIDASYRAGAVNPGMTAGLTTQQLANAKALQRQRGANAANAARQTAAMPANSASRRPREAMNAELAAMMARSTSTNAPGAVRNQRTIGSSTPAQRQAAHRNQPPNGNRQQQAGQSRSITQEQIIVGHFCRHAIKTLARVMQNNPRAREAELQLKEHIKSVWAKWVRQVIRRPQLLESVANCVRNSCDAASAIDVIGDFKSWYEREYELQKQRTGEDANTQARRQTQPVQRRNAGQNAANVIRPQGGAVRPNGAVVGAPVMRTTAGRGTMIGVHQKKQEPQLLPGTGGKRIASKTVPGKQTGAVAGKTLVGRGIGRGTAGKSVGGKSISRPPGVSKIENIGRGHQITRIPVADRGISAATMQAMGRGIGVGKSPALGRGTAVGHAELVNMNMKVEGTFGGKGLVSNKAPTVPKAKAPRKTVAKGPSKPGTKVSPKNTGVRPKPPPANPAAFITVQGVPNLGGALVGKRPLEQGADSPLGPLAKKTKPPPPRTNKGIAARKKPLGSPESPIAQKGVKPPPARPDMFKARPPKKPGQDIPGVNFPNAPARVALPGQQNAGQPPFKKPKRADDRMDELDVVKNIVDIEDEENKLGMDAGGTAMVRQEVFDYGADMLLAGPRLRTKMQTIAKRIGLQGHMGMDVMEMMSLAVRERLAEVFESLREVASLRTDEDKVLWKTQSRGSSAYDKLKHMRQDEERSLQVAAEMRVKRLKDQKDQEAKRIAGETISNEKKAKDSGAAAEAERKEKVALEKKRREHSSQRDALSALVADTRRKKTTQLKALGPLQPLGKNKLPQIPKLDSSGSGMSGGAGSSKSGKAMDPSEKLRALGPLIKLGRANDPRNSEPQPMAQTMVKRRLTLRDCLFLMEKGSNTRKSSLVYKWGARLGTRDEKKDS